MPINRSIPGQLREQEAQAIEILASLVPENGVIVEVGSLLGLSSWIWAKSAHPTVQVHCIDPWEDLPASNFVTLAKENNQQFSKKQFLENVAGCENVFPHQGYSPDDFQDWNVEVDLYFEDAVHTDPIFSRNLDFWQKHLKADGILCGHDFHPRFQAVQNGARRAAQALDRNLRVIGSLWYLLPRALEASKVPAIAERIARLHDLANFQYSLPAPVANDDPVSYAKRVVSKIASFEYDIVVDQEVLTIELGRPIVLSGVVTNRSAVDWPVILMDEPFLKLAAELRRRDGSKVAVSRFHINKPALRAGESVSFEIELSTIRASPGPLDVFLDLVYERVAWFRDKGAQPYVRTVITVPAHRFEAVDPATPVGDVRFWMQNDAEFCTQTEIGIEMVKQQSYLVPTERGTFPARSMLTSYELSLLYSLARFYYSGEGKIVDLGPLIGVGTNALARGLHQNSRVTQKHRSIYSYDLFLLERMDHFLPVADGNETGSVFWRFLELNRDYLDYIVPVPGNFLQMSWTNQSIEILFVDLAKTWELNAHVIAQCFPCLIPDKSILIQQDYVHVGEPWIALYMEYFKEYFDFLYYIYGATAVYRLRKPIPSEVLKTNLRTLPMREVDRLFAQAIGSAPPSVGEVLKCCQAAIHLENGDVVGAVEIVDKVNPHVNDNSIHAQNFVAAIPANLAAVTRWINRARAG